MNYFVSLSPKNLVQGFKNNSLKHPAASEVNVRIILGRCLTEEVFAVLGYIKAVLKQPCLT